MVSAKRRNGFGVGNGDGALRLAQDPRPRVPMRQVDRFGQGLAEQAALLIGVRPVAGGSERLDTLAVGFNQSNIDPIERGAAHQTDCRHHNSHSAFAGCLPSTTSLCQTSTSYNATARWLAASLSRRIPEVAENCVKLD